MIFIFPRCPVQFTSFASSSTQNGINFLEAGVVRSIPNKNGDRTSHSFKIFFCILKWLLILKPDYLLQIFNSKIRSVVIDGLFKTLYAQHYSFSPFF